VRQLVAFERVSLAPGETKSVTFDVPARALAYYDVATRAWIVEPASYTVSAGGSSTSAAAHTVFTVAP
jgi:beta-glucosidase